VTWPLRRSDRRRTAALCNASCTPLFVARRNANDGPAFVKYTALAPALGGSLDREETFLNRQGRDAVHTPVTLPRSLSYPRLAALGLALGPLIFGCSSHHQPGAGEPSNAGAGAGADLVAASAGHSSASGGAGTSATSGGVGNGGSGAIAQDGLGASVGAAGHDGAAAGSAGSGGEPELGSEPGVTGIIAVGYGGLRIISRDLGKTWKNETHWSKGGKDDEDLLRTIAYGNGRWLSAGFRFLTSVDGTTWADRGMAEDVITAVRCPVTDGMAFGAGKFLVACGSNLASSSDGLDWIKAARTPDVGGHPYLIWDEAEQRFVCSGDDGPSFTSSDGLSWTKISVIKAHLCEGTLKPKTECQSFYTQGVFLTTEWGGVIRRSTNGTSFELTYQDEFENNLFTEYSFGVGRVAP